MQFESINVQEEIFHAHTTKDEHKHLWRNDQNPPEDSFWTKETAQGALVADSMLEDLKIIHRDILVIHEHKMRTLFVKTAQPPKPTWSKRSYSE